MKTVKSLHQDLFTCEIIEKKRLRDRRAFKDKRCHLKIYNKNDLKYTYRNIQMDKNTKRYHGHGGVKTEK